jgi:hypothetical protein
MCHKLRLFTRNHKKGNREELRTESGDGLGYESSGAAQDCGGEKTNEVYDFPRAHDGCARQNCSGVLVNA